MKRAVFLGSKALGLSMLTALYKSSPDVIWAIIHPDDQSDQRSNFSDFQRFAEDAQIRIEVVKDSRAAKALLSELQADIGFVCCWYWLLDKEILDAVPGGLWGIHNSLLPKYRGGAPLVWSIINGDPIVGSTVFRISEGMDDGDVLLRVEVPLADDQDISHALTEIDAQLEKGLPPKWAALLSGSVEIERQNHAEATYCGQRTETDGLIDWTLTAPEVHNFVRAQAPPYPCAFTNLDGDIVKVLRSEVFPGQYLGTPGQVLQREKDAVLIACGKGTALRVLQVSIDGVSHSPPLIFKSVKDRLK